MKYRSLLFVLAAVLALFAVGCAAPAASAPGVSTPAVSGAETPAATPGAGASPVATLAAGSAAISPDVTNAAVAWLAGQVNVPSTNLRLVKAERVEWTDSCFGLGGPAESCLQAITPGWRITFDAAGQQYEVHTDESGSAFRLAPQAS